MTDEISHMDIQIKLVEELGLTDDKDIIAHVHLPSLGPVKGEAEAVLQAIMAVSGTVVMPAFTYQTQIIPQVGPPDNAIEYGTGDLVNAKAEIFRPDLPVHPDIGVVAETFRQERFTLRSTHPIYSFIAQGPNARQALSSQTRENPLGPIAFLEAQDGAVLLMGVDQRQNFSLHLAEQRAGRKTFTRWALTIDDIEELHHIPGCSYGFNDVWRELMEFAEVTQIGMARCELIQLEPMLQYVEARLRDDPSFMLCDRPSCLSCRAREGL